jgi:hypothetical protein
MAAKKITDSIRNTVKAQMFLFEFESFYYEKVHNRNFWEKEDAEDEIERERGAVLGRATDSRFEDCTIEECRAYTEYLTQSSGITWDDFKDFSMWDVKWLEMFKKVKGKISGKGEKMTASEIKKYAAAKKAPKSPKSPATKKAATKKAATKKTAAKKTPAKAAAKKTSKAAPAKKKEAAKKATPKTAPAKKADTKSAAVKKKLAAKKSTPKAAPAAKKAPAKKATSKPSLGEHLKALSTRKKAA